jgi:hypothetical protein
VSLILEALRKLDRERQAPERGFLVVGAGFRPDTSGRTAGMAGLVVLGIALIALTAGVVWRLGRSSGAQSEATVPRPAVLPSDRSTRPLAPIPAPLESSLAEITAAGGPPAPTPSPVRSAPAVPVKAPQERRFLLTAISQQDGQPVAVLNDRLVREGDSFDGVRVLRIGEGEVEIEVDGQRRVVSF